MVPPALELIANFSVSICQLFCGPLQLCSQADEP